ncbi:MAG: thioesterase family protein [Acidobacteria bacterium]|nr:thioesterase family protein [Acidobacteriota bacterium]MBI3281404.1 thioesterase family protein [Acidobacteriota bacterium]
MSESSVSRGAKLPISIGAKSETRILVTSDKAISFLGLEQARVLATPWLIMHFEMTARDLVKPFLLDGQDSVGTQVNVRHLAATPMGMSARFEAEVTAVEGRRVQFRVEAWDEREKIAEGTHERFVVDVAKFATRVAAKRAGQ